ncbi:flagellar biosynthesis protein FlhB [Pannonibacter sp. Q-1]|uniref:Flagellar biosynthetic protein FlhB n=1 Tax=Pannonibacter phragmitetus TaxID=121719 RepID=A0A0L0J1A7_9HYPH|nr:MULTISPECIES: flagellar biosynthesis protein FlhB [Pannonibacter]ALV28227.1 flagellar biosynthetic protein FlhB [Pannonibacter phragmitetus]KND19210.1 flagellar biosynthesis protein FlhB [Pannonibacter phragmitetus]MBA4206723.1 flagellar biosynthesis protein FlhB [Polymorphum sp.]
MSDQTDDSEKTEDPTQKRLKEALERGDVAKSQEVSTWFTLAGTAMIIAFLAPGVFSSLGGKLKWYVEHADAIPADGGGLVALWSNTGLVVAAAVALPMLTMMIMAVIGNMVQHELVFSAESLKPKLSKVSPMSGFKRLFSADSLMNFLKGLVKIVIVSTLMVAVLWPERDMAEAVMFMDELMVMEETRILALKLIGAILAVMTIVAALDFLWQKTKWFKKQKMSLREIKEEYKQTEGDPAVKGKIRQLRMERSRRRMMSAVPQATVVVTNPTHYSVALKYEDGMGAPQVVAKGVDAVALRIREIAKENKVPIVENPPLARALYAATEIDQFIPEEHFKAAAEVIGFVYRMRKTRSWRDN